MSSVTFDESGDFLAAGDTGGRVVVFQRIDVAKAAAAEAAEDDSRKKRQKRGIKAEYGFYAEFQSHEAEFDCLKSMEVAEKINQIKFLPRFNSSLMLLTSNEKTIKLWKVHKKCIREPLSPTEEEEEEEDPTSVCIPKCEPVDISMCCEPKLVYANAHAFHINSVSLSSDQETFLSSDDLRIILWPFTSSNDAFSLCLLFFGS